LTTGKRADGSYGAAAERVVDVQLETGVRGALRLLEGALVPPGRHVPEVRVAVREHLAEDRAQHERLQVHPRLALHLTSGEVVEPLGRALALLERCVLLHERVVATQAVSDIGGP